MNEIIEAGTAKLLAGLQIDQLQKLRSGQITLYHLQWFNNLTLDERDRLSGVKEVADNNQSFIHLKTFSLTVPVDYDHANQLRLFYEKSSDKLNSFDENITDENFNKATQKLVPGKTYTVKIFSSKYKIIAEDCLAFLRDQQAILVGAQGLSLVCEYSLGELPVNREFVSFDDKEALWKDSSGRNRVPSVGLGSDGALDFVLGVFSGVFGKDGCLLCFCDPDNL